MAVKDVLKKIYPSDKPLQEMVVEDIIIPRLRDIGWDIFDGLVDVVKDIGEELIFGDGESTGGNRSRSGVINYNNSSRRRKKNSSTKSRSTYNNVVGGFESRGDAAEVLEELQTNIAKYGAASIADLKSCTGEIPKTGDFFNGWFDLRSSSIKKGKDGWEIHLPSNIKNLKE